MRDFLDLTDLQAIHLGIMCLAHVVPMAFRAAKETLGSLGIFFLDSQV